VAKKVTKQNFVQYIEPNKALNLFDIRNSLPDDVPERTLRRWLSEAVSKRQLIRTGKKSGTRYTIRQVKHSPTFLNNYDESKRPIILKQLRDLWTHTSTALEGNTITLGDTHFILEEGLTISGKPLREHQEITGHARAIDLMYQSLRTDLTEDLLYTLHKAVQSELVNDIYQPVGEWKQEVNGTYTVDKYNNQIYLEYALPKDVPSLMKKLIHYINEKRLKQLTSDNAIEEYAKIHAAIAHIHPFSDGNGRIARLIANIPLLKSGLPPVVISKEVRREYIQTLATYEFEVGQLIANSDLWPNNKALLPFISLCSNAYQETRHILFKF